MSGLRVHSTARWSLAHRLGRLAPIATAGVFLFAGVLPAARSGSNARHDAIAAAMASVPAVMGSWIGSEIEVPTGAKEILQANAILSRVYQEIGGDREVTLAIIHCTDVRDMVGHYPPACYPASGWTLEPSDATPQTVLVGGAPIPLRCYRFVRADRLGGVSMMTVLNAFILPGGSAVTDMDSLMNRSEHRARSIEGVAQIQLVFIGDKPAGWAREVAEELLSALPPRLLGELGLWRRESDSTRQDRRLSGEDSTGGAG